MIKHETEQLLINGELVDIDINCIPMVKFFNSVGLTTKFSCEGDSLNHYNIMFADSVTDKDIEDFLLKSDYLNVHNHTSFKGRFYKWCRVVSGEIKHNWMYKVRYFQWADKDLEIMHKYKENDKMIRVCSDNSESIYIKENGKETYTVLGKGNNLERTSIITINNTGVHCKIINNSSC